MFCLQGGKIAQNVEGVGTLILIRGREMRIPSHMTWNDLVKRDRSFD